eukprot:53811-Chlamydomonas_euryale.AAC.1
MHPAPCNQRHATRNYPAASRPMRRVAHTPTAMTCVLHPRPLSAACCPHNAPYTLSLERRTLPSQRAEHGVLQPPAA